jgi:hypothetical protein
MKVKLEYKCDVSGNDIRVTTETDTNLDQMVITEVYNQTSDILLQKAEDGISQFYPWWGRYKDYSQNLEIAVTVRRTFQGGFYPVVEQVILKEIKVEPIQN